MRKTWVEWKSKKDDIIIVKEQEIEGWECVSSGKERGVNMRWRDRENRRRPDLLHESLTQLFFLKSFIYYVLSLHPSTLCTIYWAISSFTRVSSIPTHFPRHMLGVFPWVWNDFNNVAQRVCRLHWIPGRCAKTPVTNHKSFVLWVVLFCGVNSWVHYRCQGTHKISLLLTVRGAVSRLVSWGRCVTLHLQQLWMLPVVLLLFVKLFILISLMSLWWVSPGHLHTIWHFSGQLWSYSLQYKYK